MDDDALEPLPEDYFNARVVPAEMVRDLRVIAQLDARTAGRIKEYLSSLNGLIERETIEEGVERCLPASLAESSESIVRTLLNITPGDVSRTIKTVDRWRRSHEKRGSWFDDEVFASLDRNLQSLTGDYPSLVLINKANYLLRALGNEFEDIAYYCDLRPVFDQLRQNVEGFVTLANMKLMYVSQDRRQHACEVALTEEELRQLIKKSEEALGKLEILKSTRGRLTNGKKNMEGAS